LQIQVATFDNDDNLAKKNRLSNYACCSIAFEGQKNLNQGFSLGRMLLSMLT